MVEPAVVGTMRSIQPLTEVGTPDGSYEPWLQDRGSGHASPEKRYQALKVLF